MAHAWLAKYGGKIAAAAAGTDIPLAMLLGHVQKESGGNPNDVTSLNERGLFQIHPDESKSLGLDHSRMFEVDYNIAAGIKLFQRYADSLQAAYPNLFPSRDENFWHAVRFMFAIGSGAAKKVIGLANTGSWDGIEAYARANQSTLLSSLKHDPVKWTNAVDAVFSAGQDLYDELGGAAGATVAALTAGVAAGEDINDAGDAGDSGSGVLVGFLGLALFGAVAYYLTR